MGKRNHHEGRDGRWVKYYEASGSSVHLCYDLGLPMCLSLCDSEIQELTLDIFLNIKEQDFFFFKKRWGIIFGSLVAILSTQK